MKKICLAVFFLLFISTSVSAHSIWINSFESHAHKPPHTMISLGWGHTLPMDDIMNSVNGRIAVERFELIDPKLKVTPLMKPAFEPADPNTSTADFDIYAADLAMQKVAMKKESAPGVYQFGMVSVPTFYTQYIDKNGRQRLQMKPRDEIKDIDKVLMSVKFQAFAKTYMTLGEWTPPKPLGHGLEIIPRTDISNLKVGDMVEVDVLFYGEPLTATAKSIEYITAASNSFGQPDGFSLYSYIIDGKAQFRIQSAGQWIINVTHKDDVTEDGSLSELYGKSDQVYHGASLTIHVK